MNTGKLIVINYSDAPAKCRLPLKNVCGNSVKEEFSGEELPITDEIKVQGVELTLNPYESKIFTFKI